MAALALAPAPSTLPGPYAEAPAPEALTPHPATVGLVRGVVRNLLQTSPSYRTLGTQDRVALAHDLVRVGSYLAECVRDDWYQSEAHLDQRPMLRTRTVEQAQSAADDFHPAAASQVGAVTTDTLRAVAFPTFVADLIRGTFNAIGDASSKQMESYMELLSNVGKTVDEFMNDNVSNDNARSYLAGRYPQYITVVNGRATPAASPPEGATPPNFTADLNLTESVDASDEQGIEDTLVPAARRKLAQSRLKMLSSMVLMGINRIVVTAGKIRATMGFHINTRDTAHAESAESLNTAVSASGSFSYGPFGVSASVSVAYVSSTKADSNAELSTQTDLTGEVELHFQSDFFPIERFADAAGIAKIQGNTPVPATNTPMTPTVRDTIPWGDSSPPTPVQGLGPPRLPSTGSSTTTTPATATPSTTPAPRPATPAATTPPAAAPRPAAQTPTPAPTPPAQTPTPPAQTPAPPPTPTGGNP